MWFTIAAVLLTMWLYGVGLVHARGNAVHLLAVLALLSFGLHVLRWRRRKVARPQALE